MHYNPLPHDKYSLFMNLNRSVHLCLAVTFTFKGPEMREMRVFKVIDVGYCVPAPPAEFSLHKENRRTDAYVQYDGLLAFVYL